MDAAIIGAAKEAIERDDSNFHKDENDGGKPIQNSVIKLEEMKGSGEEENEVDGFNNEKFSKDFLDEQPPSKKIHSFYFVKFNYYHDPDVDAEIHKAWGEFRHQNKVIRRITSKINSKRYKKESLKSKLEYLTWWNGRFGWTSRRMRRELEQIRMEVECEAKCLDLCFEEELNDRIRRLQYRIHHDSKTIAEERQLLKDIKLLEGTKEKIIANEALQRKSWIYSNPVLFELSEVMKEKHTIRDNIKLVEKDLRTVDNEIGSLLMEKQAEHSPRWPEIKKEHDKRNLPFFQYLPLLDCAKNLAAKKDVAALEELSHRQIEKFMSQWSNDKAYRDEYIKRILPSLDNRELSGDGRMRNPGENY